MPLSPLHRTSRGSSLLFVMVILAVLAIVGLAIISQATTDGEAASGKRQYDRSVACADAAREMLHSQFRLYGTAPTALMLDTPVDDKRLFSGHYDTVVVTATGVVAAAGATAGALGVSDIANRPGKAMLGGQLYRLTVVCSSAGNTRQSEVEFLVKFGL